VHIIAHQVSAAIGQPTLMRRDRKGVLGNPR